MNISAVFNSVKHYSLDNLSVHCSELVREVCEEKGHCHYYTVIWLFCESHPIYNGWPSTRRTKRQPQGFPYFLMISRRFFFCLSSESHPMYTISRPLIPGEQRGDHENLYDFSHDFAIIFSSVSSHQSHKGIHEDIIIPYYSQLTFFLWFAHVFFVCFLSVSYVLQAKLCCAHLSSCFCDLLPLFTSKLIQRGESINFNRLVSTGFCLCVSSKWLPMTLHNHSGFLFSHLLLPDWDSGRNKGETKEIERPAGTS